MYTMKNYQTKKELKEAVARGDRVEVYQPNGDLYGKNGPFNGRVFLGDRTILSRTFGTLKQRW